MYNSEIIKEFKTSKCNLTFAYDPNWKKLWSKRFENPLDDAETFRINSKGYIKILVRLTITQKFKDSIWAYLNLKVGYF